MILMVLVMRYDFQLPSAHDTFSGAVPFLCWLPCTGRWRSWTQRRTGESGELVAL